MSLVESVPLQAKIAELEERVAKLEKAHGVVFTSTKSTIITNAKDGPFGEHWDKMWEHFHEVMKRAFR